MFCKWCGKEIEDNVEICPFCGGKQNNVERSEFFKEEEELKAKEAEKSEVALYILGAVFLLCSMIPLLGIIFTGLFSFLNKKAHSEKCKNYLKIMSYISGPLWFFSTAAAMFLFFVNGRIIIG